MTVQESMKYPSKMPTAIFLDSGGVINDNALRAPQWLRYLGEFLPTTILGGTAQTWIQANLMVIKPFFSRWQEYMQEASDIAEAQSTANNTRPGKNGGTKSKEEQPPNVYSIFEKLHMVIWIKEMCKLAANQVPELETKILPGLTDEELFQIARNAHLYAIQRVKADFPGAVDTIRELSSKGHTSNSNSDKRFKLYTSSGDSFEDLEFILKGLGVFECFDGIYGADKVNYLKMSPLYYEKLFDRVGVRVVSRDVETGRVLDDDGGVEERERDEIVVLDDSVKALRWARAHGARTVLITPTELDLTLEDHTHIDYQLKSLSRLPALLESWRVYLEGHVS